MAGVTSGEAGGRRFQLQERLGSGAFGDVYLAEQESPGGFRRRVAIKVMRQALAGRALTEATRRMRDEARLLGLLSHRNIVQVLDLVRAGHDWVVVMEYVAGPDLDVILAACAESGAPFSPRAALEATAAVATALDAAWSASDGHGGRLRVVHRDIKPSNVLITADGDVKVLDFGVAKMDLEDREGKTGLLVGTERYMAPERLLRSGDGPESDIYALGATLVELLTNAPIGTTPVLPEAHAQLVDASVQRASEVILGATEAQRELSALVRRLLAYDPAHRPTASELVHLAEDLAPRMPGASIRKFARDFVPRVDGILGRSREPVSGTLSESSTFTQEDAEPTGPAGATLVAFPTPPPVTRTDVPAPAQRRSRVWIPFGLAAGVALIATVALGARLVWTPETPPPPTPSTTTEPAHELTPADAPALPPEPLAEAAGEPQEPGDAAHEPRPAVAPQVEATKGQAKVETAKGQTAKGQTANGEAAKGEAANGEAAKVGSAVETSKGEALEAAKAEAAEVAAPEDAPEVAPAVAAVIEARTTTEARANPTATSSPEPAPELAGTWVGTAGGRPLTLRITSDGRGVTALGEITQGTSIRSITLTGAWSSGQLTLTGPDGETFVGTPSGNRLSGTWTQRPGARGAAWNATRR